MNKRRDHIIEILYHNYHQLKNFFFPFLGFILSFMGTQNKFKPLIITAFVICCVYVVTHSMLAWYNKVFEINKHHIRISKGVYNKTNNEIPLSRVKSINTTDSLLKRLFNISNFHLEIIGGSEISFVLSNKEIERLKSDLFYKVPEEAKKSKFQRFTFKEYWLLAFTSGKLFLTSLSICFATGSFVINHFATQLGLSSKEEMAQQQADTRSTWSKFTESFDAKYIETWLIVLYVFLIIFAIAFLINFVVVFVSYRNFTINNTGKELTIQYGFVNKKDFVIPVSHIRSVRIVEPILFQIFGYAQVRVDNIGVSRSKTTWLVLMPIVKRKNIKHLLNEYLNTFEDIDVELKPDSKAIPNYLVANILKFFRILLILVCFYFSLKWAFILVVLFLLAGYWHWRNAGLAFNDKFIVHSTSTFFKKKKVITLKRYVQTTGIKKTILTSRKNKAHYIFSLFSESITERYQCSSLDKSKVNEFLNYIVKTKH